MGPDVLNLLQPDGGNVAAGVRHQAIYLLFIVGLEIDLEKFNRVRGQSLTIGILHFLFGMATGASSVLSVDSHSSCLLIGTLIAPTMGYPIVRSWSPAR